MAKKTASRGEDPPSKYSIIIPPQLDSRLQRLSRERGDTLSSFVRQLLEEGADRAEGLSQKLLLDLDPVMHQALTAASKQLHTWPEAVVRELLARHLPGVLDEARAVSQALQDSLQRLDAPPPRGRPPEETKKKA